MATLSVTPLLNGITLDVGETITAMQPLGSSCFLYATSLGNIYFQNKVGQSASLLLAAAFSVNTCSVYFDGVSYYAFLGGNSGNYVQGTITIDVTDPENPTQTNDLATQTSTVTDHYLKAIFDPYKYAFTIVGSNGIIYALDITTWALTTVTTLLAPDLPALSTLELVGLSYDLTLNSYLINGVSSANVNTVNTANYSIVYVGNLDDGFTSVTFLEQHLPHNAIGLIDNPNAKITDNPALPKIPIYVIAGTEGIIFISYDKGLTWGRTLAIDNALLINSIIFNKWAFIAALQYGLLLVSTDGVIWESLFDSNFTVDLVSVAQIV